MSTQEGLDAPVLFSPPHILEEDIEAVVDVLRSGWLSTGSECAQLEEELQQLTGAPHVVAMSSCTAALEVALRGLRLDPGARVGVTTWTFAASASSIVKVGATPVLLDIDEDTLNVAPEAVEAAIDGLDALMVVHFAGAPVDPQVLEVASRAQIPVVEDAAHALGAFDGRGPIAGIGTAGACFSFYATKNLTSAEGGALATADGDLASYARRQRVHGLSSDAWGRYRVGARTDYDLLEPGMKANLPDILAALARSQLRRFPAMQARRRALTRRYRAALGGLADCRPVPVEEVDGSADHLFVVVLPEGVERADVVASMAADGIGTSVHFRPLHTFTWYSQHAPVGPTGVAVADALAARTLSLPLHAGLDDDDVDRVIASLAAALS